MGTMTVSNILNEGGLLAGDTSLANRARVELQAWLRSQYASFLWPFLRAWASNIPLVSGSTSLQIGAGSNGVSTHIQRIIDPIYIYPSDYTSKSPVRVITDTGDNDYLMADDLLANEQSGMPELCRVRHATTPGARYLDFDKKADRTYRLKVGYYFVPADPADHEVPLYPNDRTLIQAVNVFILKYKRAENYETELEILVNQVNDDRLKYGAETGINDQLLLDPKVFR